MAEEDAIVMDGWLRKRGSRVSLWGDRYFVLKGSSLSNYLKQSDSEPKGVFTLTSSCTVSPIRTESNKKKKIYIFEINWPHEEEHDDTDASKSDIGVSPKLKDPKKKPSKGKKDGKDDKKMSGMKVAALAVGGVVVGTLTSGIGLLAGMTVVGMGAGGGAANTTTTTQSSDKDKQLVLQCENFRVAEHWVHAIEAQIRELSDGYFPYGSSFAPVVPKKHTPPPEVRMEEVEEWAMSSKWKLACVKDGSRLFELASSSADLMSVPPCMKINVGMNGSVSDVFKLVMTMPNACRTGVVRNLRFVEAIDSNTDVIHLTLEPIYLEPTWTAPRDFCLTRYWKQSPDGSFVVCLDSTSHPDCQLCTGYIRGEMHATYFISPPKEDDDDEPMECMLSYICQVDPKGWIWRSYGYQHRFVQEMMMHVLDIRDAIDAERFVKVTFDPVVEVKGTIASGAQVPSGTTDSANTTESNGTAVGLGTIPPPTLPKEMWDDVDASTFRIRGKSYMTDNVKANSAPSLFKLIAVDVIEVPEPTRNIAAHPRNRVALAHARGDKFWCFVVNIMVPGSTNVCFVMYYLGDKALFEQDTPFARLAKPFFFGNDDDFRNNRFKLIPKVVDGNMIIKMAVKDTPTLLGNKLKQYYFREDHYFELDVDVGSSSVARNVVGLAIGYSKAIVVDMGLCLQGNEEDELPEVLMGGCSCIHVDMSLGKKL